MLNYLIRRLLYMPLIVLGVMVISFFLFNVVYTPRQMALRILGPKSSPQAIENWLHNREFDKPPWINTHPATNLTVPLGRISFQVPAVWDSRFFNSMRKFATFDLGKSFFTGEPILAMVKRGAIPSLMITLPAFVVGLGLALALSLLLVFVRESLIDRWGALLCIASMSIPITVYVIFGQWVAATLFPYFPAFGFNLQGVSSLRFVALPILIMILSGVGADVRLYRAIFLEEVKADYIRTAHAKGASQARVLFVHVLKNGLISIITLVVASLPFLIMGTLVLESFFGIPGLGNMMFTAIQTSDFAVIQADVFVGSLLFLLGLLLTDIFYALADPRIRLQ